MAQVATSEAGPGAGLERLNSPELGLVEGSLGGSGGGCSITFINQGPASLGSPGPPCHCVSMMGRLGGVTSVTCAWSWLQGTRGGHSVSQHSECSE